MSRTDVVVIGAGIVGASIARRLADQESSVMIAERHRPAGAISMATFAWVNAVGKEPQAYFDLNVAGMAEHARLADELGADGWYHRGGNLEWSGRTEELEAKVAKHRERGYDVRLIDQKEARELEPDVRIDERAAVAFYAQDVWIDPALLVARLLDHPGITLVTDEVDELVAADGRAEGVRLSDGRSVAADSIVISTGADAAHLPATVGFELPMRHAPGLLAITEPAPARVGRVLHTPGLAVRPMGGGSLMLASDGLDKQIEPSGGSMAISDAAAELLARARDAIPAAAGTPIESCRVGLRALTGDGKPAIGPVPGCANAYLAVMHSGVTLAPLVGRLVARELTMGTADPVLEDYRPARFNPDGRGS
jgi:glycine/D-amino acid oxidase-like deaminating enzyme